MEAERRTGAAIPDSVALQRWSVAHLGPFWDLAWDLTGVKGQKGNVTVAGDGSLLGAQFFPDGRVNFAENLLRRDDDGVAIWFAREDGERRALTWTALSAQVDAMAGFLLGRGVRAGDRVAAWMPNLPETVVAMLATTAIGAVFSSTSPDFGPAGVLDRFGQIEPVVLFVADAYSYAGVKHDCVGRLREFRPRLATVRDVVVVGDVPARVNGAIGWDDALAGGGSMGPFVSQPFDHAAFILYSSGTTGPPKCIVHRAGGILLKHLVEHQFGCDIRAGDTVFWFTTCGWMMWNWLTSALASGASIVCFDGSPFHPGPEVLWNLADDVGITMFGISAKYVDALRKGGFRPRDRHELSSVRTIGSTGSPLVNESFEFLYDAVLDDVHVASVSGGTDLCGCLVGGDPTRPVWTGEIQGPSLAMDIDVLDDEGAPLASAKGELVCRSPFPSMPLGFWGDHNGSRYHDAYFSRFSGVWAQGDFASWTSHGGIVIYGRSDATLNAGGVRIGTAEIYRQVETLPEIAEAIAIGQEWDGDTRIVLFVRLSDGADLDRALEDRIRGVLRDNCSPRHVPAVIRAVADIPRTRSGKLVELAVADVVNGRPVRNREALANPEALDLFAEA